MADHESRSNPPIDRNTKPYPADTGDARPALHSSGSEGYWFALVEKVLTKPYLTLLQQHVRAINDPRKRSLEVAMEEYKGSHPWTYRLLMLGDCIAITIYLLLVAISAIRALGIDLFLETLIR